MEKIDLKKCEEANKQNDEKITLKKVLLYYIVF